MKLRLAGFVPSVVIACVGAAPLGCQGYVERIDPVERGAGGADGAGGQTSPSGSTFDADTSASSADGAGNTSAATSSSSGGTAGCEPGLVEPCYEGRENTLGHGPCLSGTRTCRADGKGFGPCEGQVLPWPYDDCATPDDEDCNDVASSECSLILPMAPAPGAFAWQGVQARLAKNGAQCEARVTLAVGARAVCFGGADDRLHCAGSVYDRDFGDRFVDAGLVGPRQLLLSFGVNSATGDAMCVVLADGTMQCLGHPSDNGQFGIGSSAPQSEFVAWGGRSDIEHAATGTWDQFCVRTVSGQVHCAGVFFGSTPVLVGVGSTLWVSPDGMAHLDDPTVLRASPSRSECQVTALGLECSNPMGPGTSGAPGQVVDGGLVAPIAFEVQPACRLEADGEVWCHAVPGYPDKRYFDEAPVVALSESFYLETMCAVYADGSLACLGPNHSGELGTGDALPVTVERRVAPPGSVDVWCL